MNENMKHERRQLKNANIYTRTTTVHHTNTHTQDIKRACRCDVTAASHTQWWIPGMGLWGPRGGATAGGHTRWWIPCNGLCGSSPGAPTSGWGRGALEKKCAKRLVSHLRWLGPHWDLSPWAYNVVIRPYPISLHLMRECISHAIWAASAVASGHYTYQKEHFATFLEGYFFVLFARSAKKITSLL